MRKLPKASCRTESRDAALQADSPTCFRRQTRHPFAGFFQIHGASLYATFLLFFFLCLASCHAQKLPSPDFYEGLKRKQAESKTEAVNRFVKALNDSNIHIASAAAAELMSLHYSGANVPASAMDKIRKKAPAMTASKASGSWARALDALGAGKGGAGANREKILALALNNASRSPDEAIQYMLLELRAANTVGADNAAGSKTVATSDTSGGYSIDADGDTAGAANISIFTNAENAAIAGRIAVSRSRYREALVFFRLVMRDEPGLFFQYPELLGDLGRSFQYTATGREGIDLFLEWEKTFTTDADPDGGIRFRLLFYSARIARQRGLTENIELFERALPWALSLPPQTKGEQIDACVWYILNSSLSQDSGRTIRYLASYIPHWQDDAYYSDVMDKLARELLLKRRWTDLINIFALVKNRPGVIGAKFAWIIGRAIQEGLLSARELEHARAVLGAPSVSAVQTAGEPPDTAKAYIRIAYNNAPVFDGRALYYRRLSAAALGEEFLVLSPIATQHLPEATQPKAVAQPPQAATSASKKKAAAKPPARSPDELAVMQFLLGFTANGAARFASRYIRMMESGLGHDDLLLLAGALGKEGQYQESMRLASLAVRQTGYQPDNRDLELLYPRPFIEQTGQAALETGIDPAKLYSLMRVESAFQSDAISRSGAIGLTQLMPATAEEVAARIRRRGGPDYTRKSDKEVVDEISGESLIDGESSGLIAGEVSVDLFDPAANIHMGAAYLAYLEERMGDPLLALLAYNGGMNRVRRWRNAMPARLPPDLFLETVEYAETMEYGRAVMGAAAMYKSLYYDIN